MTSVQDSCLPSMLMLAALRPVLVFLAEPPKLCLTAACDSIQRLQIPIQCRMQLSKISGHSSFKSPRPGLAPRFAESAQLGHPVPLTLWQTWATHEPCMVHTQDADILLPGPTVFGSSSGMLSGSSSFTRSGYSAAMDWHTHTLCPLQ